MKIKIAKLIDGENQWQESITPESIEVDPRTCKSLLRVDLLVKRRPGKIQVFVSVEAEQVVTCDRCCDDMVMTTSGQSSVYFSERESILPEEDMGDEYRCFVQGQSELDVTAEVRDALVLSIPYQNLCSPDCKGLCVTCGTNLNQGDCVCVKNATESSIELN
jgi:uncharacterized protein